MRPLSHAFWLSFLLGAYYPFLLLLLALLVWLIGILVRITATEPLIWWVTVPVLVWLGITAFQLVRVVPLWLVRPVRQAGMELRLPAAFLEPIFQLTAGIVRERKLRMPHDIRLSPEGTAWVYEEGRDQRVLVLDGSLMSALSQQALAGIIAHELAHFAAGDTRISRRAAQRALTIAVLEAYFYRRASMFFNPLVWLIWLYHLAFYLVYFAHSRQQEWPPISIP